MLGGIGVYRRDFHLRPRHFADEREEAPRAALARPGGAMTLPLARPSTLSLFPR
jgi:hypothetical protein